MHNALTQVAAKLSLDHKSKVSIDGNEVLLTLCDPGVAAKAPKVDAGSIFAAPTVRSLLLSLALEDPAVSTEQADCAVDKAVNGLDEARMMQLLEAESREDPVVRQILANLSSFTAGCR
jgi:hypothetical protein